MFRTLMPRSYKSLRLTPPWPPGIESLKKSFLGSRRHRVLPPAGSEWSMYNDTLPVALALSSYLKDTTPFEMHVNGLEFTASAQLPSNEDVAEAKSLLQALIDQKPFDADRLQACATWQIHIVGTVEGIHFNHIAKMLNSQSREGHSKINASWESAFRTLQAAGHR